MPSTDRLLADQATAHAVVPAFGLRGLKDGLVAGMRDILRLVSGSVSPDSQNSRTRSVGFGRQAWSDAAYAHNNTQAAFPSSCKIIGQWIGNKQGGVPGTDRADDPAEGNNDLLAYTLYWQAAPATCCYASKTGKATQALGFEHYLNCLHRDEVDAELQSIRSQLLDRRSTVISALRMRIDNSGWTHVQVRRLFEYSSVNGELIRLTLQVAIDNLPAEKPDTSPVQPQK